MKLYLKQPTRNVNAVAEYSFENKSITVLAGSRVSDSVSHSKTFRGAKSIEKHRQGNVNSENIVINEVVFKSPSSAANFVTGASTNGHIAWKDDVGRSFKQIIEEKI